MTGEAYLPGVARLTVAATIGPANAFPQQRMRKSFGTGHLPDVVACPGRCHGGGFDLARDLYDHAVKRGVAEHQGTVRCRGYQELGRHRRQACPYTLAYDARIEFGPGGMRL